MRTLIATVALWLCAVGGASAEYHPHPYTSLAYWELSGPVQHVRIDVQVAGKTRVPLRDLVFDEQGRVIRDENFVDLGNQIVSVAELVAYDEEGRLALLTGLPTGWLPHLPPGDVRYEYPAPHTIVQRSFEEDVLDRVVLYEQRDGYLRKTFVHADQELPSEVLTYPIDADGHLLNFDTEAMQQLTGRSTTYAYRDGRRVLETTHDDSGRVIVETSYFHDSAGLLTRKVTVANEEGATEEWKYEYEFDDHGNWIVQRESKLQEAGTWVELNVTLRTIEYS